MEEGVDYFYDIPVFAVDDVDDNDDDGDGRRDLCHNPQWSWNRMQLVHEMEVSTDYSRRQMNHVHSFQKDELQDQVWYLYVNHPERCLIKS